MAIMTRFLRLVKADVHGVMDQIEDKELLLKQHFREMEEDLTKKEATVKRMTSVLESLKKEHDGIEKEIERLDADIDTAIRKEKDDIARFLIRKRQPLPGRLNAAAEKIAGYEKDLATNRNCLEQQRKQYEELKIRSSACFEQLRRKESETCFGSDLFNGSDGSCFNYGVSNEEIEMELIRRKEKIGGVS